MNQPNPTPAELGSLIRQARKAQLAGVARVGLRFIVDLEAGKPTIQLGKAFKVLEALGCEITITLPKALDEGGAP